MLANGTRCFDSVIYLPPTHPFEHCLGIWKAEIVWKAAGKIYNLAILMRISTYGSIKESHMCTSVPIPHSIIGSMEAMRWKRKRKFIQLTKCSLFHLSYVCT